MARQKLIETNFTAKSQSKQERIAELQRLLREEQERLDAQRREQDGELMVLAGLAQLPPDVKLGLCLDAAQKAKGKQQVEAWRRLGADFHENAKRTRAAKRHAPDAQSETSGVAGGEPGAEQHSSGDVQDAA